jgi:hypothetical protein
MGAHTRHRCRFCLYTVMTTTAQRLDEGEHAAHALRFIGRFTWLRAAELGKLLYPGSVHSRKYAERNLRKLLGLRMIVARQLPGRDAGTAYLLATRGAQFLNDWNAGTITYKYRVGYDWGITKDGVWEPPRSWRHDLMATGVLACLRERKEWGVFPETMLRAGYPKGAAKFPDGLLVAGTGEHRAGIWLEVENARKSGRNIDTLARALALASIRRPMATFRDVTGELTIARGMVAINADACDERGHRLSHITRVESALRKVPMMPGTRLTLLVAWVKFRGIGVDSVLVEEKTFSIDKGYFVTVTNGVETRSIHKGESPSSW